MTETRTASRRPGPGEQDDRGRGYRVAIIDDQPVRRRGMELVIGDDPQFTVVAAVTGADELLSADDVEVVVIDLASQADAFALDAIIQLAKSTRPLVISSWDRPPTILAAIRAGAAACLSRLADPAEVVGAIKVVTLGGFYVCSQLQRRFQMELVDNPKGQPNVLAPREIETLRWIARGFTQAQIATRMSLSEATVNTYAKRIRAKLHVTNKAELTRMAIQLGHVSSDDGAASRAAGDGRADH